MGKRNGGKSGPVPVAASDFTISGKKRSSVPSATRHIRRRLRRRRRPSLDAQERPGGDLNGMEYKIYEEWDANAQKIQADLEDAGHKLKQALIDSDYRAAAQWQDKYNRLLQQSEDHMAKIPPKFV